VNFSLPSLPALLAAPELQSAAMLVCVVALERWLHWPEKYHPLSVIKLLARRLAEKVHKGARQSHYQQKLAGTLALLILVPPLVIIFALLASLSEFPLLFNALLFLVALQFQPIQQKNHKIYRALAQDRKILARQLLSAIVLRETQNLSPLGVGKACIESQLLRFAHQYCSVVLLYLIGGGALALAYRLVYECSQMWNGRNPYFRFFGQAAAVSMTLIQWIPARLAALCFALAQNVGASANAFRRNKWHHCTHLFLLHVQGAALGIELGGPAFYGGQKYRFDKVGGPRPLRLEDMQRTTQAISRAQTVLISFAVIAIIATGLI
jgi:adenosylcobinamide-phosphate synthase